MGIEMTNIELLYIKYIWGASIKGQRYFVEIHLSRGVLVPINHENRGGHCNSKLGDSTTYVQYIVFAIVTFQLWLENLLYFASVLELWN